MTSETETDRRGSFVTAVWPWLVGAAMLAVFVATLYHSATPMSLSRLADLSGWNWRPKMFAPVTFLATYPLHWLPPRLTAVGMNLFNAVCAALVLVLLARSVALLPHDRTNEQRQREQSETSILTIRSAWLPPLFAVLVCGLQLTFWENAVEFRQATFMDGGEMFNLLLFAYAVRCLLEFRVGQRDSWISRFALVLGLGMANDWFMVALFPAFIVGLVWIKGFEFFNWRFLLRTVLWGLAGLLVIFLFPLIHGFSLAPFGNIFRYSLHYILSGDGISVGYKTELHTLLERRWFLILLSLSSILPVLLIGIRWASSFGDSTPIGVFIATSAFNISHAFLLLYCLWNALDGPFGPRQMQLMPGVPFLSLYYLGALSVGYFSGYFLLVFGAKPARPRQRPDPIVQWFGRGVVAAVWLLAAAVPLAMVSRNLDSLQKNKALAGALERYFARAEKSLPPRGAVVLSDDAFLSHELQSVLVRRANQADYLMLDTTALSQGWSYIEFLEKAHPEFQVSAALAGVPTGQPLVAPDCVHLIEHLATNHPVYYLHPSYGYYFERFYPRSHGLVYELQFCPASEWETPPPTPEELAENRTFWENAGADLKLLLDNMEPSPRNDHPNPWQWFQQTAQLSTERNGFAGVIGRYYSRALNNWGVELATAGFAADAGKCYALAKQLNPGNASARINLEFNESRLAGVKPALKQLKAFEAEMGDYQKWFQIIGGGPVDEPSFCSAMGMAAYLQGGNFRQAVHELERARALMPDNVIPVVQLSQALLYIQIHTNVVLAYAYPPPLQTGSNALALAEEAVRMAPTNPGALFCKAGAQWQLGHYELAVSALDSLLAVQPTNFLVRYYRGTANIEMGKLDDAKKDYESVLKIEPAAYQVYYGLGDIAYKQKDNEAALKYYELYLARAPASVTNSPEVAPLFQRVEQLKAMK